MKQHAWLIFRLLVTVALLGWIFHGLWLRSQMAAPLTAAANADWLVAAWLAAGLGEIAGLLRFWCCLHLSGIRLPIRRAAALQLAGMFTSLYLPGMAGGDALKVALLALYFPQHKLNGLLAVVMDRLSGFVVITLWTLHTAWARGDWFAHTPIAASALHTAMLITGPLTGGLILGFLLTRTRFMRTRIRRFPFRERILQCEAGFDAFAADRLRILTLFATSITAFSGYFLNFHFTALAYGAPLQWRDTFAIMPLVDLIAMIPVTIAGLGLREQAFQLIFAPLCGLTPTQGVTISLVGFFIASTWALLGAPVFLWLRPSLKSGGLRD